MLPPRSLRTTMVREWNTGETRAVEDDLVGEEPLEIRVAGVPVSVTMRTPGCDEELAAGFLFSEGVLESPQQVERITCARGAAGGARANVVDVQLRPGVEVDAGRLRPDVPSTSSCGICGRTSIEAVRRRGITRLNGSLRVTPEVLCGLPSTLREHQELFDRTGGPHAAALFDAAGRLLSVREDVGRHNAVDKVIGRAFLDGLLPLSEHVLLGSGRASFEIVQKAIVAGIAVLACVSAPSALAVQMARELGLTLAGFLRGQRFVVYSGEHRIRPQR